LVRDESPAGDDDTAREAYMARWIRAALDSAGDRPVVVVTGGFHRAALIRLVANDASSTEREAGSTQRDASSTGPGAGSAEREASSAGPGVGSVEHDAGSAGPGAGSVE